MVYYVNKDTDFDNVVITNSYDCLTGGDWTATVIDGETVYVNDNDSSDTRKGPVNLIGANLTITNGAIVDSLLVIGTTENPTPTISVEAGGTLENSTTFNAAITINSGGVSQNNSYVSSQVIMNGGTIANNTVTAVSTSDYFYNVPSTSATSGTLNLETGSISFQTSTDSSSLSPAANSSDNKINTPQFIGLGGKDLNGTLSATSYIGDISISSRANYANWGYGTPPSPVTIGTPYNYNGKTYSSAYHTEIDAATGDVLLVPDSGKGSTLDVSKGQYQKSAWTLYDFTQITISAGTTLDDVIIASTVGGVTTKIIIEEGGSLTNSTIFTQIVTNNGTSEGNNLIGTFYTGNANSVSKNDFFLYGNSTTGTAYVGATTTTAWINGAGGSVTLNDNAQLDSLIMNGASDGSSFKVNVSGSASGGDTSEIPPVCFLAGSMIHMENGLVAIESINIGDKVITYNGNKQEASAVIWVGQKNINVKTNQPEEDAGYPVRILKDAIAEGVPFKDLLVTSEHCILQDGGFVPVRMLINGVSIFYDHSITEYTYYHIETEQHSIISADGVLTESYLDTGNRSVFGFEKNVVSIVNHKKEWNVDSAAPLTTQEEIVKPIFMKLAQRAVNLGFEPYTQEQQTINESQLYLITDSGEAIYATHQSNGHFFFKLPEDVTKIRLKSLTSRPSKTIGCYVDDRRDLGVLVGKIHLIEKYKTSLITEHLTSKSLKGWDVQEQTPCRWTNGNAALTVRSTQSNSVGMLVVEVLAEGPYILPENNVEQFVA